MLLGASLDFWILESRHPEILESPGFGLFLPISNYRLFFPLSFCQGIEFWTRNSRIPSFLESSKKLSGTLEFPWKFPIFWQFQSIGYFSYSTLSLELDFECRIPKFCHSWNLLGIMWNSGISLEVDYILPNLTYLVSIWPNVIILYPFGVSLDLWSLELGDPKILESPGFGKFQHVVYFPNQFVSRTLIFNAELQRSIIPGIFQELPGTLEFL